MSYRILVVLILASHWPVWAWYGRRMMDGSDEPWGLLALLTVLVFVPWKRMRDRASLGVIVAVALAQTLFLFLGEAWVPILRAMFVVSTLACIFLTMRAPSGLLGLLCLSLPWIATLQFYLGYPLRVLTGEVTRWMLQLGGLEVQREGISLLWNSHQVVIDRPCAGIYMLWFGGYLSYLLACLYRLTFRQCALLGAFSFLVILTVNILRNFILFFVEIDLVHLPAFAHEGIGLVLFILAVGFLAKITETRVPGRALRSID